MTRPYVHHGGPSRLEHVVCTLLPNHSRRRVRSLIASGRVRLNGAAASKGVHVRDGDQIAVEADEMLRPNPDLAVPILHEDDTLAVLDKPAGIPSVALDPCERATVSNFVLGRFPECEMIGGPLTSGVAHRLDTGSSGILLVARSSAMWQALREAFRSHRIHKEYVAVVHGEGLEPGPITLPLEHDPRDPRRMRVARGDVSAWQARTTILDVEPVGSHSRIRVATDTGVMHQVRVHLAALGAPLLGDTIYGGAPNARFTHRHALHATRVVVPGLSCHSGGDWTSSVPAEFGPPE